jgi:hypothetical protein
VIKKLFLIVLLIFFSMPVFSTPVVEDLSSANGSKPLEVSITFDWISKTQLQRDENIKSIQSILFNDKNPKIKYSKKEFKAKYANFLKNKNFLNDYDEISKGKREDADKYYCGFYLGKLLIAYGIQYKKHPENIYYYDSMGSLRWVDVFSKGYPKYPYFSYQYYKNGEMAAAYYYASSYDQYVFSPDKKFRGRWYREKLFNKKAKVIMTRSNY